MTALHPIVGGVAADSADHQSFASALIAAMCVRRLSE
jgi:hypothetical protein